MGTEIITSEGLGTPEKLHPLQAAFVEQQAAQCGYCTSGMLIAAADLLKKNPQPSEAEIKMHLDGHLCRCGSHVRVIRAINQAAKAGVRI